jgi:hypothetical protein
MGPDEEDSLFTRRGTPAGTAQVKGWVREAFSLSPEASVLVGEIRCSKPGCPPRETVIAMLVPGSPPIEHKLLKPIAEICRDDVQQFVARG